MTYRLGAAALTSILMFTACFRARIYDFRKRYVEDARFLVETRDSQHDTIMPQWHGEVGAA